MLHAFIASMRSTNPITTGIFNNTGELFAYSAGYDWVKVCWHVSAAVVFASADARSAPCGDGGRGASTTRRATRMPYSCIKLLSVMLDRRGECMVV
jgi:hypothetical protein